jgi:hypothetical protein
MSMTLEVRNFDEYLRSLSRKSRKQYAYVKKHNTDLVYEQIPFDEVIVHRFMSLWEHQLINGKYVTWAFPVGTVKNWALDGDLLVFQARNIEATETIAVHFIQKRNGYWECHPPMYDKKHNKRYLGKFMWFSLFKYAAEHNLGKLDLGGDENEYAYKQIYKPK